MILVLFGTNPYSFDRLAKAIENYAVNSQDQIIAQIGNTKYIPQKIESYHFIEHSKLIELIKDADVVITQGGFGSLVECVKLNKKIVAVPRIRELGECQDDGMGQLEIVKELERAGKLVGLYDTKYLKEAIEKTKDIKYNNQNLSQIPKLLYNYIRSYGK